ncbi:FHA domain-containing protein [Nocardiopsis sp. CC223A]|uniref:FHA domain-containing protein n=1 Tax=Nocardiopsis sp. CC223A TaxID=3044051 RepID=UPI00278C059E|nr:FHA domain-containing protein [Nocardiopsis sp. CC223A]
MATYRCGMNPEGCPTEDAPGYCRYHPLEELVAVHGARQWSLHLPALGRTVPIPEEGLSVGRDAPAFAGLPGMSDLDQVSRDHARLEWRDGSLLLSDRGSSNGTFVDGTRLADGRSVEVGPGHTITFAKDIEVRIVDDEDV